MIDDLSKTLRAILSQSDTLGLDPEQIVFDAPTKDYDPDDTVVNLFLYDIRENTELRSNERSTERQNREATIHLPPLRVACSYLVTVWPAEGDNGDDELSLQEHRLLGQVLQVLSLYPTIPVQFLQGSLVDQQPPLPMVTARADGLQNPAEFWTSLENRLRASLNVTVTISMPVFADVTGPIVTTQRTGIDVGTGVEETLVQIGGRALDTGGNGVAGALVDILDTGLRTNTDSEGRYTFPRVPVGTFSIRVVATGFHPVTQSLVVPGLPEDYQVILTPL